MPSSHVMHPPSRLGACLPMHGSLARPPPLSCCLNSWTLKMAAIFAHRQVCGGAAWRTSGGSQAPLCRQPERNTAEVPPHRQHHPRHGLLPTAGAASYICVTLIRGHHHSAAIGCLICPHQDGAGPHKWTVFRWRHAIPLWESIYQAAGMRMMRYRALSEHCGQKSKEDLRILRCNSDCQTSPLQR